jgi:long-chain acyl-CoA synthetase
VEQLLATVRDQVNDGLDPHERLAFIAVVDGPWSIGNGLITPTLKIRRAAVEEVYSSMLEQWRAQNRPVVWESIPAARMESYNEVG